VDHPVGAALQKVPLGAVRAGWSFARRVVAGFLRSHGMLLAGAIAYNVLLSLVPLITVLLVGLSQFVDEHVLLQTIRWNLGLLVSQQATLITDQVESFLTHRQTVGVVGGLALLFFSSMAFSVVESAIAAIFYHRHAHGRRHFVVSVLLPYLFITMLGLGLLVVSVLSSALEVVARNPVHLFGHTIALAGLSHWLLRLVGVGSLALLLTGLYLVMPVGRVALRHAVVGGVVATVLWEIVRVALMWYFAHLSMASVVYGSMATVVIALLTLEALGVIVLLGAQVIAEIERARLAADAGVTPPAP
jgi:YihY family inner membrane protein